MPPKSVRGKRRPQPADDAANRDSKALKLTFKDLADLSLDAEGLKDSNHGDVFQLNLLMLVFWRARLSNYSEFALATEHPETDKFDDIVFIYQKPSDQARKCRCLQAKHREASDSVGSDASKDQFVTEAQLLSKTEGNFALQKYFGSFLNIKKETDRPGSSLFGCEIEDISILANKRSKLGVENFETSQLDREPLLGLSDGTHSSARRYQIRKDSEFCKKLKAVLEEKYSTDDMKEFLTFIETLGIIVDYPNRTQVNEMLLQEMEAHYSILDGAAKIALYRDEMLKWFAERKCTFLTPAKCDDLFASLEGRVRSYELLGSTNAYFAKTIGQYQFQDDDEVRQRIQCFLESSDVRVLLFRFDKIELAQPRISQAFMRIMQTSRGSSNVNPELLRFIRHFGYIFIFLDQLLNKEFIEKIKSELNSTQKGSLLVIDSQPMNYGVLADFIRDVHAAKSTERKVIIFTEEKLDLNRLGLPAEWKVQNDGEEYATKLSDLTLDSQHKFRQQSKVLLQSKEKTVEEVFEADDEDMMRSDVLAALMFGKELEIGATFPETTSCYIERTFIPGVRNDNPNTENGMYYLLVNRAYDQLGRDKYCINEWKLLAKNNRVNVFSDLPGMGKSEMLTSLSKKVGLSESGSACWVVRVDLNRYSSGFSVESLKRGRKGKYRKSVPSLQKGNIASAVRFLLELFHLEVPQSQLPNDISRQLFERVVERQSHRTKIALFFDGFDELRADYVEIVLDLLQTLEQANVAHIFLTSRPFMKDELEKVFTDQNSRTFHMDRFLREQECELLEREWTHSLLSKDDEIDRLQQYARIVIEKHRELIAGVPLHIHLLADVFEEDCREFLEGEDDAPQLVNSLTLWQLYEELVEKKFNIYCKEKAGTDSSKGAAWSITQNEKERFCEEYQVLAAFCLLSPEDFADLCIALSISDTVEQNIKAITTGEDKRGFVDAIWNGVPHFVHQTFAEYFLSTLFAENLLTDQQPIEFYNILIRFILNGGDRIRFLDTWLDENLTEIEASVLGECRKVALDVLVENDMVPLWSLSGRAVLSFILDESSIWDTIERYSIHVTKHTSQVTRNLEGVLSETDKRRFLVFLEKEIQRLIMETRPLGHISPTLVSFVIDMIKVYGDHFVLEKWSGYDFIMEEATRICGFEQIRFLLDNKAAGRRALQSTCFTAAREGHLDAFTYLLNSVDPNALREPLMLHDAVQGGNEQICQIVLDANRENMKKVLSSKNSKGERALWIATSCERSNICKMLLKEYVVACKQEFEKSEVFAHIGSEVLDRMASTLSELYLHSFTLGPSDVEEICNVWKLEDSIFHLLIYSGSADAACMFFQGGFDFRGYIYETVSWLLTYSIEDIKYKCTLSILLKHIKHKSPAELDDVFLVSVSYGNIEVTKVLLEAGVDATTKSREFTMRYSEAEAEPTTEYFFLNCLHMVADKTIPPEGLCELILNSIPEEKRVELLRLKNNRKETPLHIAATNHHETLIREMLDSVTNADTRTELISLQQQDGRTVFHCCYNFGSNSSDLLALLIGYMVTARVPSTINTIDKSGRSVLHDAVSQDDFQAVRLLLSNGADLMAVDSKTKSVLHLALERSDYDFLVSIVNCFDPMGLRTQINAPDSEGRTPLDYAEHAGVDSIVKLLVEKGGRRNYGTPKDIQVQFNCGSHL